MVLFDTDALSNILKKNPSALLIEKLIGLPADLQFTTSINIAEIYFGAYRSKHRRQILQAYEDKVFPNLNILPFDTSSGKIHGRLKAQLEKKGLTKSEPDLRIAAIAVQHKMILVTGHKRHFSGIPGLIIEDWISG